MNRGIGQHQLEGGVINAREVAGARGLVLFRAEGEGVHVDPFVGVARVVLVGLNEGEVGPFALRETVLAVKLELSGDDGILTPAVEIKRRFGKDKGPGVGDTRGTSGTSRFKRIIGIAGNITCKDGIPLRTRWPSSDIDGTGVKEETRGINKIINDFGFSTERHDGVRERVNPVSVVEGLGTERLEEGSTSRQGRAVINIGIGLNDEDQLFAGVIEVQLDLVGRRPDRLITSELELFDEVLVGVLGHTATLIRVQEDVVDIEGGGDEGLVVGASDTLAGTVSECQIRHGPQALINRTNIEVDLDFVVLKGNQGKRKPRVAAVPELEGDIEGSFGEGITGLAHLGGRVGGTRTINFRERRISDKGQLSGISNHLKITAFLFLGQGELIPQVHPVTILTINALTTNFNFNLRDHLLSGEIEPTGPDTRISRGLQTLVDFRQSHLQVGAVSQITVAADRAGNTATKISLTVKGLFNRFHRKVRVATVSHLPKGNLRVARQIDILCSVGYELHQTSSHCYIIAKEKNFINLILYN